MGKEWMIFIRDIPALSPHQTVGIAIIVPRGLVIISVVRRAFVVLQQSLVAYFIRKREIFHSQIAVANGEEPSGEDSPR